ncbi:hypothetical protein [Bacteriophage Eos]|nr:hypothetical protein [Bacteriophage Eos]
MGYMNGGFFLICAIICGVLGWGIIEGLIWLVKLLPFTIIWG